MTWRNVTLSGGLDKLVPNGVGRDFWNSPQNVGVNAGNRTQVNRKMVRTFFCVHVASFHWAASVGMLVSNQFHF